MFIAKNRNPNSNWLEDGGKNILRWQNWWILLVSILSRFPLVVGLPVCKRPEGCAHLSTHSLETALPSLTFVYEWHAVGWKQRRWVHVLGHFSKKKLLALHVFFCSSPWLRNGSIGAIYLDLEMEATRWEWQRYAGSPGPLTSGCLSILFKSFCWGVFVIAAHPLTY